MAVQFGAIGGIRDDEFGPAGLQPVRNGGGAEGRKKRLINRAGAPCAKDRDHEFRNARQQPTDDVARADTLGRQKISELAREFFELAKCVTGAIAGLILPFQRDVVRRVPVATFDAGVDAGGKRPLEAGQKLVQAEMIIGLPVGRFRGCLRFDCDAHVDFLRQSCWSYRLWEQHRTTARANP